MDGWTFLSDADAEALTPKDTPADLGRLVVRPGLKESTHGMRAVDESLDALWKLKREVLSDGLDCPHVLDDKPVVCAWYPTAEAVLLWNLGEAAETFRLRWGDEERAVKVEGLGATLVARH